MTVPVEASAQTSAQNQRQLISFSSRGALVPATPASDVL